MNSIISHHISYNIISCLQSGLALLPATESIKKPMSVTLGDSNSVATTGRPNGLYMTSQTTPLLPKVQLCWVIATNNELTFNFSFVGFFFCFEHFCDSSK